MLFFKNVPVVIEPGVAALEVAVCRKGVTGERLFYVPFARVETTAEVAAKLPFIVSSAAPHIFSMTADLDTSPFLLVYDYLGKLSRVYTREVGSGAWLENATAPEQVGDTVTQFSVRFSFNSVKNRDKFMRAINGFVNQYSKHNKIKLVRREDIESIVQSLASSKTGPVVLPIAVAKPKKSLGV